METILEQLIADFHERNLPPFTPRHIRLPLLPNKADTVIGMRRSGKTYFVYQTISELVSKGIGKESILYLNLEDERLLPMTAGDLHRITDTYYRRYPHLKDTPCWFFFDEIQNIPGWEHFIRRILDQENAHVCITGSSAKLLSREISTSLRGRAISTEIFPFSFLESLVHAGVPVNVSRKPGSKKKAHLENRFQAYLIEGGFPEVQGVEPNYRIRILQDYLDVVILRDLVERFRISNTTPLRYLIRHLIHSNANLFSVNKFYNYSKSQGIHCSKNTLHEFLDYLTDAFLFFQIPIHAQSERSRMVNPKKMYAVDTGLVRACSRRPNPDWGSLLENFVFLELRRNHPRIEYYRTKKGLEIDFITLNPNGESALFQVSAEMQNPETRNRELSALTAAMNECGLHHAVIITEDHEERIQTDYGEIDMIPAWLWTTQSPAP